MRKQNLLTFGVTCFQVGQYKKARTEEVCSLLSLHLACPSQRKMHGAKHKDFFTVYDYIGSGGVGHYALAPA